MSDRADRWAAVAALRREWHRTDDVMNALRDVHARLESLHDTLVRNRAAERGRQEALDAFDRLGGVDAEALGFLTEPVLEGRTVRAELGHGAAITPAVDDVASSLAAYADGGAWGAVESAVGAILADPEHSMGIDTVALSELSTLLELAVEAGIRYRDRLESQRRAALESAYAETDETLGPIEEQPIALLPVRLETRFVDEDGGTDGPRTELLVRIYPDQIHTDSHEGELTDKEISWGRRFWATLWYARHPDPAVVGDDPSSNYLRERLPEDLRERVAGIDPAGFSADHAARYRELKERAWQQLVERFGRERAGYVVDALEPTDGTLATDLLTEPPAAPVSGDGGEPEGTGFDAEHPDGAGARFDGLEDTLDATGIAEESVDLPIDGIPAAPELPERLPGLEFPSVSRRPKRWTKQARARLLPDRWIAIAEWEDHTGESHRTAIAGDPVRGPLAVGPSAESVAAETLEDDDGFAPGGTEWMVDFQAARAVGMGLRLPLRGLSGFDPERGFTRLSVVGVRASVDPGAGSAELADLLDAHHYTDGLAVLPQGTPTNNHDVSAGAEGSGLDVECSPPLVETGDLSDGDLLARALSIDPGDGERHVFASVANADGTEQRDARHTNSALWPATIGYSLEQLYVENEVVGNPPVPGAGEDTLDTWSVGEPDRERLETEMLWLDAYRRHFIRYVRARGPFPALRVGDQPYGVLPAAPIETERDLSLVDPALIADLGAGDLDLGSLPRDGLSVRELAANGAEPTKLLEAGADPTELVDAGVEPRRLVAGGVDPEEAFDAVGLVPDSLLQDGIGFRATSQLTAARLEAQGVPAERLESAGITPRALARGEVTAEQLESAGITTERIASVLLPEQAKALGITPAALERAGVTPETLLDGGFTDEQVERLGLTTRGVADAVLPDELRELGVTPRTIEAAEITPRELLDGDVSAAQLETAGITAETVAEALLPAEAKEFGITAEAVAAADVSAAELFNGDVGLEQLEAAGFDVGALESALLPDAFREAGITTANLTDAGITPDAVVNGLVTPDDLVEAGLTPTALAEAGVLPDAVSDVSQVITDLIEAGLDPLALIDRGLTPDALVDAGVTPETLIEAGLAPKRLVDAGIDAIELASSGATSGRNLLDAGVSPAKLLRAGLTVADMAGGDLPVRELATSGATALELVSQGADALDLASGGARPSALRDADVDAGTLREAGKGAGSLRVAGYSVEELLAAGYTLEELLNGGFSVAELSAAGVDPDEIPGRTRDAAAMLAAGHAPARLRQAGFAPDQLLEGGLDVAALAEAGYTAGELVDAGLSTEKLLEAGLDVEDLRAADVDTGALLGAGVEPDRLREHGATAEELLAADHDPEELLAAGFERTELEVAGVDVDGLLEEAAEGDLTVEETADAVVEGLQYAATVLEEPEQAQRDSYRFSFDPAVPKGPPRGRGDDGADAGAEPDGGVPSGTVPVVRPLSVDDRLDGRLARQIRGFATAWSSAAESVPFGHDLGPDGLVAALERSAVSTAVRQRTMLYSGELLDETRTIHAYAVCKHLLRTRVDEMQTSLSDAGLDGYDPRIGYFSPLDVGPDSQWVNDVRAAHEASSGREYQNLYPVLEFHLGLPKQGSIEEYDVVDADIGRFIDALLDSSVDEVHTLGSVVDEFTASRIDPSAFGAAGAGFSVDAEEWSALDVEAQRNRIVRAIEAADDPVEFGRQLSPGSAPKITQLAKNARDHGDSGVLRSLLRILLQHGLLQEYLTARRRLGLAYDDLPSPWFDPAYAPRDAENTVMETLRDEVPEALKAHPDVDSGASVWYRDALRDAAANYDSTSSIDPRVSEFADSVRYLGGLEPPALSTLVRETLDLASHRLDAWWTSVATKRVLELREAQGTVDPDGNLDHDSWEGAGSDVPRATLDPSLVGTVAAGGRDETERFEGLDAATRQFDPASLTGDVTAIDPSTDGGVAFDPDAVDFDAAERVGEIDPTALGERASSEPGIYVGGYGFVENLSADVSGRDDPEYIHAPSEQHATTAAILKSGADAHDADEGENALALDLSAARVRAGLRLIRGVRRGQALGELLGYRFERRLHEATVGDGPDLMQYADVFREEFPRSVDGVERPDESDLKADRLKELAARDTVDGLALLEDWESYPFGRGDDLPPENSDAYEGIERIVTDLGEDIDAAGDMLVAESVHQIGQGNFERAGGSLDALATGAQLPDPDVIETPRTGTGLTHRHCLLVGETGAPVGTPRGEAAPSLSSWVETMLPELSAVSCAATYRWEESDDGGKEEASTTLTLETLGLGPLDVLFLFGADREEARSELEQRLAYHLIRNRPAAVPADAEVQLQLTETGGEVSAAELLELARSIREFVQSARPATAVDLAHPGDFDGEGYTEGTADALRERADDAQDRLYELAVGIDERLALLDADHAVGDGTEGVPAPGSATGDGGLPAPSWDDIAGSVFVPMDRSPVLDEALTVPSVSLPERIDALVDAVRAVDEEVPLDTVATVADAIDPDAIRDELSALLAELPAGSTSPEAARADHRVAPEPSQPIAGYLLEPASVPDVDGVAGEDTSDDGVAGEDTSDDGAAGEDPSDEGGDVVWDSLDPAGEDIMGVTSIDFESVRLADRPEIQYTESVSDGVPPFEPDTVGGDGAGETATGGDSEDEPADTDWSETTVTVRVWGTDGTSWFEAETTATPDAEGYFDAAVDFSDVDPGTSFQVAAVADGSLLYSATGRVVADGDPTAAAQATLRSECATLKQLLWLRDHEPVLSAEEGPSARLVGAHDQISDWDRIRAERDAVDPETSTATAEELDALDNLADLESFDPSAVPEAVAAATAPVERLGLDRIVDLTGDSYWLGPNQYLTGVRARIARTLADPSLYNAGAAPGLLKYDHETAALLHGLDDGGAASAYLDAFLAQPAWTLRYLDAELDARAATILRDLTAWLYDPDSLGEADLAAELGDLAAAARKLPALSALFDGLPGADGHEAFADHLDTIAAALGTPGGDRSTPPEAAFDTNGDAVAALRDAVDTERATVETLTGGPPADEAFRNVALEQLRETMTVAASYGVYGSTPSVPDGGTVDATRRLVEQARALLERLRTRLNDAAGLDPRTKQGLSDQPVPQRVDIHTDRLERLFGDGFTVLPPFSPANRAELRATFTDDELVADRSLAAETWLQRSAPHRDRIEKFREARSYAGAIAGSPVPSPTIGQLPFEAGDTWVGVDGVEPEPGRISILAEFGPGVTPELEGDLVVGLSVDEWTETVPSSEETTGIALNYDDPGNRAPQSILLVPPPEDGSHSLDYLAATVAETAEYAKRRSVVLDDFGSGSTEFDPPFGLFPALHFAERNASGGGRERATPTVDFGMLDWYDKRVDQDLLVELSDLTFGGWLE